MTLTPVPPPHIDVEQVLRAAPLLNGFTDVGVRILAAACERRTVHRGTYAFRAGDPSDALLFIARGSLQLVAREGGAPLGDVRQGDTLGGFSLIDPGEHLVSALAPADAELLVFGRAAFERIQREKPGTALKLTLNLTADLSQRLRDAKAPLREFLAWQVSKRKG